MTLIVIMFSVMSLDHDSKNDDNYKQYIIFFEINILINHFTGIKHSYKFNLLFRIILK